MVIITLSTTSSDILLNPVTLLDENITRLTYQTIQLEFTFSSTKVDHQTSVVFRLVEDMRSWMNTNIGEGNVRLHRIVILEYISSVFCYSGSFNAAQFYSVHAAQKKQSNDENTPHK